MPTQRPVYPAQLHGNLTGRVRRPAAHRALGRNHDGLVCAYRPHSTPALLRAKARLGLRPRCSAKGLMAAGPAAPPARGPVVPVVVLIPAPPGWPPPPMREGAGEIITPIHGRGHE